MKESWIFTISIIAFLCATTLFITGCPNSENSSSVKNGETKKVPPSKTDSAKKSEKTDEPKKETKEETKGETGSSKKTDDSKSADSTGSDKKTADDDDEAPSVDGPVEFNSPQNSPPSDDKEVGYREELFKGWGDPEFVLFISGRQHGYIEPCGCTGLANQKGGMMRRHTLQKQLKKKGWKVVSIDAGNQVRRFGIQPKIKFTHTVKALSEMKYDVVGFGPDDLRIPAIDMLEAIGNNFSDQSKLPFTSCNVKDDFELIRDHVIVQVGEKKIGITTVTSDENLKDIVNDGISFIKAGEGIMNVWKKLKEAECDKYVLVSHSSIEESKRLAEKFPYFNVVITTGGAGEPTRAPEIVGERKTAVVQVGIKGMYVGVVGFFEGARTTAKYQRIPLDSRFEDSKEMQAIFTEYQETLKRFWLAGLKLEPAPHPSGRTFVGSNACADCHPNSFDIWKDGNQELGDKFGAHWHATKSLVDPTERTWVKRNFDPECVRCHSTG